MRRRFLSLFAIQFLSLCVATRAQQPLPKPLPVPIPTPSPMPKPSPTPPPLTPPGKMPTERPKPPTPPQPQQAAPTAPKPPDPKFTHQEKAQQPVPKPPVDLPSETAISDKLKAHNGPSSKIPAPQSPVAGDRVLWSAPLDVRYGATFDLLGSDPYSYEIDEAYEFVETGASAPIKVLGYCEEKVPFLATDPPESFCPLRPPPGAELRFSKRSAIPAADHVSRGYLQEEFVLSAQPIWILMAERTGRPKWRFLNYFQGLQDPFHTPNNARMTTLLMPPHTFVSLDQAQREDSPDTDIYHFPRQFLFETLQPRTTVITRVNPGIPGFLRWGAQKLLAVGVSSVVWQWVLMSLTSVTPFALIGWFWRVASRRRPAD